MYTTRPFKEGLEDVEGWAEDIAGFDTFTGAFNQIMRRVPKGFITGETDLALEDRVMAYVTIFSAIGIALVQTMERNNHFNQI